MRSLFLSNQTKKITISITMILVTLSILLIMMFFNPIFLSANSDVIFDISDSSSSSEETADWLILSGKTMQADNNLEVDENGVDFYAGEGKIGFHYKKELPKDYAMVEIELTQIPGYIDAAYEALDSSKPQLNNMMLSLAFSTQQEAATNERRAFWEGLLVHIYFLNPSGANVEIYYNYYGTMHPVWNGLQEMNLADSAQLSCGVIQNENNTLLQIGEYIFESLPDSFKSALQKQQSGLFFTLTSSLKGSGSITQYPFSCRILSVGGKPLGSINANTDPISQNTSPVTAAEASDKAAVSLASIQQQDSAPVKTTPLWQKDIYKVNTEPKHLTTPWIFVIVLLSAMTSVFIIKIFQNPSER